MARLVPLNALAAPLLGDLCRSVPAAFLEDCVIVARNVGILEHQHVIGVHVKSGQGEFVEPVRTSMGAPPLRR